MLFVAILLGAQFERLACTDEKNAHYWIRRLVVDTAAKAVTLELKQGTSPRVARLAASHESSGGRPVYAFHLPPLAGADPVTNVFKLFSNGSEWRLIEAALLDVNGTMTLRAIGQSVALTCTESSGRSEK